jgi:quercetin dioxygenase-like cupin family protein
MNFFKANSVKMAILPGNIVRKVFAYDDKVMTTYWEVPAGAVIPEHAHPHVQFSIIISGKAEYTIGGETHLLQAGDSCVMPSNVPHNVTSLEPVVAIDVFTPIREDFLK